MKKLIYAAPFIVLTALTISIIIINTKESEPKDIVRASEPEVEPVTQQDREEYRWNNPANPKGSLYQVEDAEVDFDEFVEVKKNVNTERGHMSHCVHQ